MEQQRPLSRAYLSLCPFNKLYHSNKEEDKSGAKAYSADKFKPGKLGKTGNLKEKIRMALIDSGYPSAKVDDVFKEVSEMPSELVESYYEMLKENIKQRLHKDPDFKDIKKNRPGQYDHLDKF